MGIISRRDHNNHFLSFHFHHHHHQKKKKKKLAEDDQGMMKKQKKHVDDDDDDDGEMLVPKGFMAVMVGHEGELEQKRRFVIPVMYIYHPLFMELLKEAEEEYGFHHSSGPINIPCDAQHFSNLILQAAFINNHHHHHHFFYHHHHHHHHHHIYWCFKA